MAMAFPCRGGSSSRAGPGQLLKTISKIIVAARPRGRERFNRANSGRLSVEEAFSPRSNLVGASYTHHLQSHLTSICLFAVTSQLLFHLFTYLSTVHDTTLDADALGVFAAAADVPGFLHELHQNTVNSKLILVLSLALVFWVSSGIIKSRVRAGRKHQSLLRYHVVPLIRNSQEDGKSNSHHQGSIAFSPNWSLLLLQTQNSQADLQCHSAKSLFKFFKIGQLHRLDFKMAKPSNAGIHEGSPQAQVQADRSLRKSLDAVGDEDCSEVPFAAGPEAHSSTIWTKPRVKWAADVVDKTSEQDPLRLERFHAAATARRLEEASIVRSQLKNPRVRHPLMDKEGKGVPPSPFGSRKFHDMPNEADSTAATQGGLRTRFRSFVSRLAPTETAHVDSRDSRRNALKIGNPSDFKKVSDEGLEAIYMEAGMMVSRNLGSSLLESLPQIGKIDSGFGNSDNGIHTSYGSHSLPQNSSAMEVSIRSPVMTPDRQQDHASEGLEKSTSSTVDTNRRWLRSGDRIAAKGNAGRIFGPDCGTKYEDSYLLPLGKDKAVRGKEYSSCSRIDYCASANLASYPQVDIGSKASKASNQNGGHQSSFGIWQRSGASKSSSGASQTPLKSPTKSSFPKQSKSQDNGFLSSLFKTSEPSQAAFKKMRQKAFSEAHVDPDDPNAAAKMKVSTRKLPPEAPKPASKEPKKKKGGTAEKSGSAVADRSSMIKKFSSLDTLIIRRKEGEDLASPKISTPVSASFPRNTGEREIRTSGSANSGNSNTWSLTSILEESSSMTTGLTSPATTSGFLPISPTNASRSSSSGNDGTRAAPPAISLLGKSHQKASFGGLVAPNDHPSSSLQGIAGNSPQADGSPDLADVGGLLSSNISTLVSSPEVSHGDNEAPSLSRVLLGRRKGCDPDLPFKPHFERAPVEVAGSLQSPNVLGDRSNQAIHPGGRQAYQGHRRENAVESRGVGVFNMINRSVHGGIPSSWDQIELIDQARITARSTLMLGEGRHKAEDLSDDEDPIDALLAMTPSERAESKQIQQSLGLSSKLVVPEVVVSSSVPLHNFARTGERTSGEAQREQAGERKGLHGDQEDSSEVAAAIVEGREIALKKLLAQADPSDRDEGTMTVNLEDENGTPGFIPQRSSFQRLEIPRDDEKEGQTLDTATNAEPAKSLAQIRREKRRTMLGIK